MVILLVALEVFGQVVDPFRQDSYLDFRRTGVAFNGCIFLDELSLTLCSNRHRMILSISRISGRRQPGCRPAAAVNATGMRLLLACL
ncbi:hypothetical protein D3C72_2162220 [compost metagenome]